MGIFFFDDELETVNLGYSFGMIAYPPYLVTRGPVDSLKNQQAGIRRTGFIEVGDYRIGNRILHSRHKDIGAGLHKPEFHTASDGGRKVIGQYDQHLFLH
jgi:hypothetical protein